MSELPADLPNVRELKGSDDALGGQSIGNQFRTWPGLLLRAQETREHGVLAMKLHRRSFLQLAAGAAVLPATNGRARALGYPTRPVRWIVGFAPGGSADIHARLIARWLSERLGQQFIVENRPGAGSNIAIQAAVNAQPDGYTL